ncbi:undecaprenyl-diphosphate phosphatase [Nocardioides yefusunii]|uniref:Undecaprenyl-diphosphatase n=1 Tax=Nocardioides yefusunii TaxID=2500546 RepID=A0ABW1QVU6_9ACTN|nr:undecaprenyl-diphosphate phosphatase [Nocardioides yefusunii]
MWDMFKAVVLGTLQGLTEFLPISSSAHLRIFPELFGWEDPGAAFTAVVQIGTELAVLIYFRKDIWNIATNWVRAAVTGLMLIAVRLNNRVARRWNIGTVRADSGLARESSTMNKTLEVRMGWYIIFGSIPIVLLGIFFKDLIEEDLRNLWIVATMLVVMGVVLGIADRIGRNARPVSELTRKDALAMGLAQAMALIPGVSRSGATISMGLFLGLERAAATRFAFLLAIPAVVGAGIFTLPDIGAGDNPYGWGPTALATVISFVVGYAAIAWLLRYVSTKSYTPFVIYRIALGLVVMVLLGTGVLAA